MKKTLDQAEKNAKMRDIKNKKKNGQKDVDELKKNITDLCEEVEDLTGIEYGLHQRKKQNSKIAFAQLIQHNVQFLNRINYLTNTEVVLLWKVSGYVDFKTNVIVQEDSKNRSKTRKITDELPKAATIQYIGDIVGVHRTNISKTLNSLKDKGIVATAETGMTTADGRVCTSRTWFINPQIIYCGDKNDIDMTVQMIFKNTLRNLKDQNGKRVKLPVNLFL